MTTTLLNAFLSLCGLTAVKWQWLPYGLYCFNYHRIGDPAKTNYDHDVFSCDEQRFEQHVALIQERFQLVNVERLLSLAGRPRARGDKPLALITFDDGYIDNYRLAFPILRGLGATAVFFLPTAFIGTSRVPWWDEIAWVLRAARRSSFQLPGCPDVFSLGRAEIDRTIRRLLLWAKGRAAPFEEQVEEIRERCGVSAPCPVEKAPLFLDWDQAREMHAAGMDIGAHTHSHGLLSRLSVASQRDELASSKAILERELGCPVLSMAYPQGTAMSYTPETVEVAEAVGYKLAFNYVRWMNPLPLARPLEISRLGVFDNMDNRRLRSLACFPQYFS